MVRKSLPAESKIVALMAEHCAQSELRIKRDERNESTTYRHHVVATLAPVGRVGLNAMSMMTHDRMNDQIE
jgi:hypothetical protein